ncbi:MAG: hypothetical protein AAGD25_05760, partial [Cyanobacteria bacterium P01_F01_bin.150]
ADQSLADQSLADQSLADQSLADQSLADQSLADQSLADQSLADQSLADQSLADQSLADQSLVDQILVDDFQLDDMPRESELDILVDTSLLDTIDDGSLLEQYDAVTSAPILASEVEEQSVTSDAEDQAIVSAPEEQTEAKPAESELESVSESTFSGADAGKQEGDRPSPIPAYTPSPDENPLKSTIQDLSKLLHSSLNGTSAETLNQNDTVDSDAGHLEGDGQENNVFSTNEISEDSNVFSTNEVSEDSNVLGLTGFDVLDSLDAITDDLLNDDVESELNAHLDNDDNRLSDSSDNIFPTGLLDELASDAPMGEQTEAYDLVSSVPAAEEIEGSHLQSNDLATANLESTEVEPDKVEADALLDELDSDEIETDTLSIDTLSMTADHTFDELDDQDNTSESNDLLLDDDNPALLDVEALIQGLETDDTTDFDNPFSDNVTLFGAPIDASMGDTDHFAVSNDEDFSYADPWSARSQQVEASSFEDAPPLRDHGVNNHDPATNNPGVDKESELEQEELDNNFDDNLNNNNTSLEVSDIFGGNQDGIYTVMDAAVGGAHFQEETGATGEGLDQEITQEAEIFEQPIFAEELEIADANEEFFAPNLFASEHEDNRSNSPLTSSSAAEPSDLDVEIFDPSDPVVRPLLQRIADLQHQRSEKMILAEAYRNLGNLYRDRIEQGDVSPQNLIRAMQAYKQVLHGIDDSHAMWPEVLNDMGNLCWLLSRGAPSPDQGLPHLLQGIQSYRMALTKIDPKADPQTYPMVQNNLGAAYGDLARYQDPVTNLQNSINAYQEALLYRSIDREPLRYASTQNNLGTTYWNLAQHVEPTDNLKRAIASYSEALRLYRPDTDPLNYAMIQNNLGTTYWNLAQHEQSGDWLRLAIMAYETALKFRTLETNPAAFAATQNNLGTAYWHVATYVEEEAEAKLLALQNAIKAYNSALSAVETLEYQQHPAPLNFDVLATHNNLGLVQYQISTESDIQAIEADSNGYLDQAIDHHLVALQGWQGRPELRQTALGCVIQTLQAIYNQKGLTAQNLALSKIPGHMLPEIMPKL